MEKSAKVLGIPGAKARKNLSERSCGVYVLALAPPRLVRHALLGVIGALRIDRMTLRPSSILRRHGLGGLINGIRDDLRLRHEQGVTCRNLSDLRIYAFGHVDQHGLIEALSSVAITAQLGLVRQAAFSSFVPNADILIGTCESLINATSASLTS